VSPGSQKPRSVAAIPEASRLPEANSLRAPLSCLNEARYGIAWGAVGAARASLGMAFSYAMSRHQFGRPIAAFQLTQAKLVEMTVAISQAYLLARRLAELKDRHEIQPHQISLGKLANARAALEVARTARQILGANGITLEYPVMRHAANLESAITYEGTHEMHTLIVGEALTRISAVT
jgi:glutaryl-CoA dehydrogenase